MSFVILADDRSVIDRALEILHAGARALGRQLVATEPECTYGGDLWQAHVTFGNGEVAAEGDAS